MVDASTATSMFESRGWIEQDPDIKNNKGKPLYLQTLIISTDNPLRQHLQSHEYRQLEMENTDLETRVCPLYTKTRPPFLDSKNAWIIPREITAKVSNFRLRLDKNSKNSSFKAYGKNKSKTSVDLVGPSAARGLNSRPMHVSTKSKRVQKMIVGGIPREEAFYEHVLRGSEEEHGNSNNNSNHDGNSSYKGNYSKRNYGQLGSSGRSTGNITNYNSTSSNNNYNGSSNGVGFYNDSSRMMPREITRRSPSYNNVITDDHDITTNNDVTHDYAWSASSGMNVMNIDEKSNKKKKTKAPPKLCLGVSEPGLVGKEVELGLSYNIKRKFLGKRAIVLGASPISGGAFPYCCYC
jgi:hypothetical protein